MDDARGFLGSLFDFSFSSFVTSKVIKLLYALAILLAGLTALALVVAGFSDSVLAGIGALVISPLVFLLYVIGARIWLEIVIVVFRISENTGEIARREAKPV